MNKNHSRVDPGAPCYGQLNILLWSIEYPVMAINRELAFLRAKRLIYLGYFLRLVADWPRSACFQAEFLKFSL